MFSSRSNLSILALALLLSACGNDDAPANSTGGAATVSTAAANASIAKLLPLDDQQDFADARRGLIASQAPLKVTQADGKTLWDMSAYDFVKGDAPASVNPSLWRQTKLNNIHGLFEVTKGIYQLRGFDLANISLIQGKTGWILVDPLTTAPTARNALAFARKHLGEQKISAIVFTHSHIDHFGGIDGVLSESERSNLQVIAPLGFMEEASSENILAGPAMQRRAQYMYGSRLQRSAVGHVDTGLGKQPPFGGDIGILEPTDIISKTGQTLSVDGLEMVFQYTPASEAPAEMTFYIPQYKAFCGAEVVSHTLHNLYTLRGAKVRDALKWSGYIDEAINLFGNDSEVYFASHHWPIWGQERIHDFLKSQRDTYKFIHDQTLRMANAGYTPKEIAAELQLPSTLEKNFANRGYYGTLSHNSKAVYQAYFGWYDGNPANLDPLPPAEAGAAYVDAIGGADKVLAIARQSFDQGQYRWAAELLNHLVFAQPENKAARELLASTYDQLGYQAESGPWRDVYLTGAYELRNGPPTQPTSLSEIARLLEETPLPLFFASMAASLNGPRADGKHLLINFTFTDLQENHVLEVENAVLHHRIAAPVAAADATISLTKPLFLQLVTGSAGLKDTLFSDDLNIEGSRLALLEFFKLLDKPQGNFNIIEP
ncbi:alkyl/aryl-sulfatase [Pseudomonas sp. N040]|uniref:alkyl/aryl-sulfatase n=1 Tax=Pseudomonas sp. N040 TaxID=2785325 RepID=UPI0018A2D6C4|nr:alkyl sulfatase dimerization domain-containing protein [Pseudomonas sp. N040]MBF7729504.1 MBL fold metallo-hydrolase [Pseudomonas sp. N040]MBW7013144.1 MBL fold metallo-hydrolase [Pseudomonas sp. N040]